MTNPVVDLVGDRTGRIVPVYPQSEKVGLMTWQIGDWVAESLRRVQSFDDPLPTDWRQALDLVGRDWAMHQIHAPDSLAASAKARQRLAFDELLRLQLILVMRKRAIERESVGIRHDSGGELVSRFRDALPFSLTEAQATAISEIGDDMAGAHPMHRLLQGDVGSGKTVVAIAALLTAVQGGHQGALMAPTEVLAEQHYAGVSDLVRGLMVPSDQTLLPDRPLRVALLTNRTAAGERARLHAGLADGTVDILIGTHALLTESVAFRSLGCVVIDEQHRFGVEQRAALREKGPGRVVPDVLVMTATPIPRTAAMTVYGDLDTTILAELPPGRTPVTTKWARGPLEEAAVWDRVRTEVAAGRQAYVVCPLVEESERVQARSASEERDRLAGSELCGLRIGLLHGQMPAKEKEAAMESFRARAHRRLGGYHRYRGGRGCAERHRHGDRGCRPLRHRPAAPATWTGGKGSAPVLVLPAGRRRTAPRRSSACRPWSVRPTGSSWPRWTWNCAARGPYWAPGRRVRPTCNWPPFAGTRIWS